MNLKKYERVIRYAMQMELDGADFFKSKADKVQNETAKALFLKLAKDEMEHYDFLKRHLDKYIKNDKFKIEERIEEVDLDIFEQRAKTEHLEATIEESFVPDITVLRLAYLIERDYKEFYEEAARNADEPIIKELFETLAAWEAGHEIIFKEEHDRRMKEYMTLPWGG